VKGQRFESLEEAQAYLDRWDQRWADTRIHGHDETAACGHVQECCHAIKDAGNLL